MLHAELLCYFDKVDAAEESYSAAVELGVDFPTLLGYGMLLLGAGKFSAAADVFCQTFSKSGDTDPFSLHFHATAQRMASAVRKEAGTIHPHCNRTVNELLERRHAIICDLLDKAAATRPGDSTGTPLHTAAASCKAVLALERDLEERLAQGCHVSVDEGGGLSRFYQVHRELLPRELLDVLVPYYQSLFNEAATVTAASGASMQPVQVRATASTIPRRALPHLASSHRATPPLDSSRRCSQAAASPSARTPATTRTTASSPFGTRAPR